MAVAEFVMSFSIDAAELDIPCPRCGFFNEVTIKQARTRDVVICRGCKRNIQLDDYMNQVRTAERQVRETISALTDSLGSLLTIDIKL